jgi:DNA-binding transcriptional regulator YhcF (GntR family)
MPTLAIETDRNAAASVGEQLYTSLRQAIIEGRLQPGRRLPSGRDLAAQLGVARGTILVAYERLASEKLVFGAGSAGTRVCAQLPPSPTATEISLDGPLDAFTRPYSSAPLHSAGRFPAMNLKSGLTQPDPLRSFDSVQSGRSMLRSTLHAGLLYSHWCGFNSNSSRASRLEITWPHDAQCPSSVCLPQQGQNHSPSLNGPEVGAGALNASRSNCARTEMLNNDPLNGH